MVPLILRLDVSGSPLGWVNWQGAVMLYAKDRVAWSLGENRFRIHGGYNRLTGQRSFVELSSIVAVRGMDKSMKYQIQPPLNNRALFRRDRHMCMYCGQSFSEGQLTRDHVVPSSRGGKSSWTNLVTACKRCNHFKGNHLLDECGMQLLALPYTPNHSEYLALRNSGRILADQMEFLKAGFSKDCRWV